MLIRCKVHCTSAVKSAYGGRQTTGVTIGKQWVWRPPNDEHQASKPRANALKYQNYTSICPGPYVVTIPYASCYFNMNTTPISSFFGNFAHQQNPCQWIKGHFNFREMRRTDNVLKIVFTLLFINFSPISSHAADRFVPFKYGNFDTWVVRHVHESAVIGGDDKTLYEPGPAREITSNNPYVNIGGSPWGTSNVMAKVMGIVKTNVSVYRDAHGSGHCAKLMTHIETCKVLGLMNIKVLAAGSIFLGDVREPITGTKDGPKALNWGIPFTLKPKALRFDYRVETPGSRNRIRQNGFSKATTVAGPDYCIATLYLQKRHEDANGNITAQRVGTVVIKYGQSTKGWVDGATYEIHYGNITGKPFYDAATMGLRSADYARNSKGKSVIIRETGWAAPGETPTHIILQFSSSHGGAYVGTPGNTLWIDNVGLVY